MIPYASDISVPSFTKKLGHQLISIDLLLIDEAIRNASWYQYIFELLYSGIMVLHVDVEFSVLIYSLSRSLKSRSDLTEDHFTRGV